jgi:hypothetical protein
LTTSELKNVLLESATVLPALLGKVQGGRAVDPAEALRRAMQR